MGCGVLLTRSGTLLQILFIIGYVGHRFGSLINFSFSLLAIQNFLIEFFLLVLIAFTNRSLEKPELGSSSAIFGTFMLSIHMWRISSISFISEEILDSRLVVGKFFQLSGMLDSRIVLMNCLEGNWSV